MTLTILETKDMTNNDWGRERLPACEISQSQGGQRPLDPSSFTSLCLHVVPNFSLTGLREGQNPWPSNCSMSRLSTSSPFSVSHVLSVLQSSSMEGVLWFERLEPLGSGGTERNRPEMKADMANGMLHSFGLECARFGGGCN